MKNSKAKTFSVEMIFDNKAAADNFFANWLDGGGDGGGNIDWNTTKWDKKHKWMRVKGTGYAITWQDGKMIIETPEVEAKRWEEAEKRYKLSKKDGHNGR